MAIFVFQGEKNLLANAAAEALTGYSRSELLKMDFWAIIHPDYREMIKQRGFARQRAVKVPPRYELKIIRKDGAERWLEYTGGMIRFRGKTAVIGTATDITKRKQAQEQVKRNLSHLKALHEINLATTSTLDLQGVLEVLLERMDRFLPCASAGTVTVIDPQTGTVQVKAFRNTSEEQWEKIVVSDTTGIENPTGREAEFHRRNGFVHYLRLPLIAENATLFGHLCFLTHEEEHFTEAEVEFLSASANEAAGAIQNAKLYGEMKRKSDELAALNTLTIAATQSLNLNSVLQETVRSVGELFHFDRAGIYIFNESMDELHLKASFEAKTGTGSGPIVATTGEGVIGKASKSGEPAIFADVQTDRRYEVLSQTGSSKKAGMRFLAAIPIRSKLKSWGALACEGRNPRRLAIEEIDLLIILCNQVAIAIENATLFEQTAGKAKELSALYSIAGVCAHFLDLNALLRQSMRKLLEIFGFTAARIYIFDGDHNDIRLVAQEGFSPDIKSPSVYRRGEGLVGTVVETGAPLLFSDMQTDPDYHRLARAKIILKAGFRAGLFIPLKVRGETLGVINLVSKEIHPFTSGDLQLINSIAYHLGVAIGNAKLLSQLRQKTNDLEKANKAKTEFLNVMSHELRTPLNVIMGYTELMQEGMLGPLAADLEDAALKITEQTQALLRLINDILVTTKIEAGGLQRRSESIDLEGFFNQQKRSYEAILKKELQLVWNTPADLPGMKTDREKLERILQNLIDNAIKFTAKGIVTISARYLPQPKNIEFKVSDTGIGIERDKLPLIFEMFRQLDSSETRSYQGVGLGLYIVKNFAALLGGTVKVESEVDKGSTFTVAIPLEG